MNDFQCSPQDLRNGSTNADTIAAAISRHPVHQLNAGDIGHAGVAAALTSFREAWTHEFQIRKHAADEAGRMLQGAANDSERVDTLLAQAIAQIGNH